MENCHSSLAIERPTSAALTRMLGIWVGQILIPLIEIFLIPLLFIGSNAFIGDEGWVSLLIAIPFTFFVYVIPAFFSLFF